RRAERHVDDVQVVAGVAVTVGIDDILHALNQRYAAARGGNGGTDLDGVEIDAGRNALAAAGIVDTETCRQRAVAGQAKGIGRVDVTIGQRNAWQRQDDGIRTGQPDFQVVATRRNRRV